MQFTPINRQTMIYCWTRHAETRAVQRFGEKHKLYQDLRRYSRNIEQCTHCDQYRIRGEKAVYILTKLLYVKTVMAYPISETRHKYINLGKRGSIELWNNVFLQSQPKETLPNPFTILKSTHFISI